MSYLENSLKRTFKTQLYKKVLKYKKKRSGYIGQLSKAVNKIEKCFSKSDFSKIKKYDNSLDEIMEL